MAAEESFQKGMDSFSQEVNTLPFIGENRYENPNEYNFPRITNQLQMTTPFPRLANLRSSTADLQREYDRLDRQVELYDQLEDRTEGFKLDFIKRVKDIIFKYIDELELEFRQRRKDRRLLKVEGIIHGQNRGRGLSYKGKKHGFIRHISRMAKGLKMGGALDNANISQYLGGWWKRLRDAGPAPAEAIESDGDFWEAFRYVLENPGEKAGYPKRLLALIFRLLDERGILFERVAGQLVPGPFFQNHEDMADLARDFFINNVMLKDNNA
jgi:hypothetical protein